MFTLPALIAHLKMIGSRLLVCVLWLISGVRSWYVCDQVNFCQSIRNAAGDEGRYSVVADEIKLQKNAIRGLLLDRNDKSTFEFNITALQDGTFRFFVNDPNKPRHTITEALDGEPKAATLVRLQTTNDNVEMAVDRNLLRLWFDPFGIDIYRDDRQVIGVNAKSKMVFEKDAHAIAIDLWLTGDRAYGIPEHAERLSLKDTGPGGLDPYRLFNVDYAGYQVESRESLYGSVPVLYGHGARGSSGAFWLNSAQTFVDIERTDGRVNALFMSESGAIDLFLFTGPTLNETVRQYVGVTGKAPLPQYFALGFHQSRYNYDNQTDLLNVVAGFDANDFPLDVVWLDIDYTDGLKYFTWNPENFSDPLAMQRTLNATGRKLVVIIDPHIKVERGYFVYDQALERGYFAMNTDGSVYEGKCWPGVSSYIDYTNPEARAWYSTLYSFDNFPNTTSITYIWNDMNEPAVFESAENTMPMESVAFHGGWLHRDVHNAYGFLQTTSTYAGLIARSARKLRPFVLTRSHFAGSQRYAAMWTGDNVADWNYLRISVPMCLTESLAGISFCGADVGGFLNDVEDELFQRWYQVGAWLPFYRSHATKGTKRREPYLYPAEIQARLRASLRERYVHLPYWYTLWWEHAVIGTPVIRPLVYHYDEEAVLDVDHEWLVGADILVSPVMEKGATSVDVYFPGDHLWYRLGGETATVHRGGSSVTLGVDMDSVPVFYRGGSVIVRKDTIRPSSVHTHKDDFSLYVFLDDNGVAAGNLYVDDYESFDYEQQKYSYVRLEYDVNRFKLNRIDRDAYYDGDQGRIKDIYIYGAAHEGRQQNTAELIVNGRSESVPISRDVASGRIAIRVALSLRDEFEIRF